MQQTTNVTILNHLNNTNYISKSSKKDPTNEIKKEDNPIINSMLIKKIYFDQEKNQQNENNINNIIYDVNSNLNNIFSKINNNINNNESISNKNNSLGRMNSTGVSLSFNISDDTSYKKESIGMNDEKKLENNIHKRVSTFNGGNDNNKFGLPYDYGHTNYN